MYLVIMQRLLLEAALDVIYFPLWWYTGGVKHAARWCFGLLNNGNRTLAPGLWLQNIFVPMFGQYDWQGKLVSFFMRSIQVVTRSIALLFWTVVCLILFLGWLVLPIVVVYGLITTVSSRGA